MQKIEADIKGVPDSLKPHGSSASASARKIEAGINGNPDSLKPNGPSASASVRKTEDNSVESSDCRESSYGCKQGKEKCQNQLATKKSPVAEERSNKDSGMQEGTTHNEHDSFEASGSKGNHLYGKAQEKEVQKQFTKQKSMPAEERYSNSCEASGSRIIHSNSKADQVTGVKKQLTKQKSMPTVERCSRESNGLDERPQKKQKLNGSVTVPDGRNTKTLQNISSDGKKDMGSFKRPRDKVAREEVPPEKRSFINKQDLGVSISEGKHTKTAKEKVLSKKPSCDGKLLKHAEDKRLADDNERNYQVIEVTQKPDAVSLLYLLYDSCYMIQFTLVWNWLLHEISVRVCGKKIRYNSAVIQELATKSSSFVTQSFTLYDVEL